MSTQPNANAPLDPDTLRTLLEKNNGKRLWRSLEELAETPEYRAFLENEFPHDPTKEPEGVNRRDVLKWMAASAALSGLTGCTKLPEQRIVPYVHPPEEVIPGKPLFYATSMTEGGIATGLLVESHMGRPTKIEGNPGHPASLGATDIFAQASVLGLYDPDRSQTIIREGRISSWGAFLNAVSDLRTNLGPSKGAGLRILTGTVTSPTLGSQIQDVLKQFPQAQWHQWEPVTRDGAREGTRLAFGHYSTPVYHFEKADIILSLDSNFLSTGPGTVRYARDFAARRLTQDGQPAADGAGGAQAGMNRLYVVEQSGTTTGAMADHRLAMRAADIEGFARALGAKLGVSSTAAAPALSGIPAGWIEALARDLQSHRGASLVIVGEQQPAIVHALAHAMNAALGGVGSTVAYINPIEANPVNEGDSLKQLVADMAAGRVQTLFILGPNPVYSAPADLEFAQNLLKVNFRAYLGLYEDETGELCHWHIPAAHELESWSDARAYDGTAGMIQPLIAPLYDGKTAHEIVSALQGHPDLSPHDAVRQYWQSQKPGTNFEAFWETSLHDGVIAGSASLAVPASVAASFAAPSSTATGSMTSGLEVVFRPDPSVGDGRYTNNGWLQELPKPITRLTWDNTLQMSPGTALQLGLTNGDYVRVDLNGRYLEAPVYIVPGHADNSLTMHLGYGRKRAGRVGNGAGFSAYLVQASWAPWIASGAQITKLGKRYSLATTQHHSAINPSENATELESDNAFRRDLVRISNLDEYRANPKGAQEEGEHVAKSNSLYPAFEYKGYAWGMAIDLNKCVGCNACVVACQAENNISVVGKDEVERGREMHWIRVDTYFRGPVEQPETYFEPVPCMHCENAPCEYVCPVGATVHSPEGLNEMIYNRCVGTRYCSNNCPYKVRRFNFLLFSDWTTPSLMALRNPNVTVRSRGVMEKCTYCVQRIQAVKIEAEKQDRPVRDGEIVTACQAVCPAQAIVFGDINNSANKVAKWKAGPRNYTLLEELNTRPRTTYLARLRNPNPEMPRHKADQQGG
jgi:molybdopterin-containing oxidoreductase family iron-sulfur binding subunit